jgi:hypothetical protein
VRILTGTTFAGGLLFDLFRHRGPNGS